MARRGRAESQVRPPPRRAVVAAARRAVVGQPAKVIADVVRRAESWQREAWSYFDETPEVKFAVRWTGDAFAKLRLYIAVVDPLNPSAEPQPARDADGNPVTGVNPAVLRVAEAELARLRAPIGGQSEILRILNMNLEVAGEAYLVGEPERQENVVNDGNPAAVAVRTVPEQWGVFSIEEVNVEDATVTIQDSPSGTPRRMPPGTVAIRIYQRHPRWSSLPDSWVRGVLRECQALDTLTKLVIADANSKRAAGILFLSNDLVVVRSSDPDDGPIDEEDDGETNAIMRALDEAYSDAIADPEAPSAVAPILMRGETAAIKDGVHHLSLSRESDATLDDRIERRVRRLARGANVPVEVVEGHMSTTFSNAEQIDQDAFEDHLEPRCVMVVDALTAAYLHPNMIDLRGVGEADAYRFVIWYDPSALVAQPDTQAAADAGLTNLVLSAEAWRRTRGFDEGDAPSEAEVLQRAALMRAAITEQGLAAILAATGYPVSTPVMPAPAAPAALPAPSEPAPAPDDTVDPEPVLAAGRRRRTGERLAAIDRDLRTRLLVAANEAMTRALERAGNRAKSKAVGEVRAALTAARVGPLDVIAQMGRAQLTAALRGGDADDLLDGAWDSLAEQFIDWGTRAQAAAVDVVSGAVGGLSAGEAAALRTRQAENLAASWQWFRSSLEATAVERMFDPSPKASALVGEFDESLRVPAGMVRQALARAGGATGLSSTGRGGAWVSLTDAGTRPPGGIATGTDVMETLGEHGAGVEGYVWVYGAAPRRSFDPHLDLDGQEFVNFDDPVLLNPEGWPATYCLPGDHDGCLCDFTPVIIERAAVAAGGAPA